MSEVEPAKVMRRRREVVIGVSLEAMSGVSLSAEGEEEWAADLMGWPPQPVCWHIVL